MKWLAEKMVFTFIEVIIWNFAVTGLAVLRGMLRTPCSLAGLPWTRLKASAPNTRASSMSESWGLLTVYSQPGTFCPDITSFKLTVPKKKKKNNSSPKTQRAHFSSASVPVFYFIRPRTYVLVKMTSCLKS